MALGFRAQLLGKVQREMSPEVACSAAGCEKRACHGRSLLPSVLQLHFGYAVQHLRAWATRWRWRHGPRRAIQQARGLGLSRATSPISSTHLVLPLDASLALLQSLEPSLSGLGSIDCLPPRRVGSDSACLELHVGHVRAPHDVVDRLQTRQRREQKVFKIVPFACVFCAPLSRSNALAGSCTRIVRTRRGAMTLTRCARRARVTAARPRALCSADWPCASSSSRHRWCATCDPIADVNWPTTTSEQRTERRPPCASPSPLHALEHAVCEHVRFRPLAGRPGSPVLLGAP